MAFSPFLTIELEQHYIYIFATKNISRGRATAQRLGGPNCSSSESALREIASARIFSGSNSGRLRNDLRNVPLFDPENNLADAISRRADSLEEQQGLTYQAAFDIANIQVYQEWFGNGKRKRIATDRLYSKDSDSDSEPLRGKHVLQKKPPNPPEVSNCSFFSCCCC